jgi:hypothetical protein
MAPVDSSLANMSQSSSFELVCSSQANDLILVRKFRSTRTGLTVVLADVDGPVVNGYFVLGNIGSIFKPLFVTVLFFNHKL